MVNDQRYLFCLQTFESASISFGYDDSLVYHGNLQYHNQPISPIYIDGSWHINGWNNYSAPSIGIWAREVYEYCLGRIDELSHLSATVFPNPSNGTFKLSVNTTNNGIINVSDLSGKVIKSQECSFNLGETIIDLDTFTDGVYIFKIILENGESTQVRVVKH